MSLQPLDHGFSSLGCPELDFEGVCGLAARYGMRHLELRVLSGRTDLPTYFAATDPDLSRSRALLAQYGQSIRVLGTSARLLDGLAAMGELRAFGPLAQALDVPYLRIFDGGQSSAPPQTESDFAPAIALWQAWEKERHSQGWSTELIVETHDAFVTSSPLLQLESLLDGQLGVLWDSHHTWRQGGEDVGDTWAVLAPFTRHVHVKDSVPSSPSDAKKHCTYTLPGAGEFPFATLETLLTQAGYRGVVSLEWEKFWHPELPPLAQAIEGWQRLGK